MDQLGNNWNQLVEDVKKVYGLIPVTLAYS